MPLLRVEACLACVLRSFLPQWQRRRGPRLAGAKFCALVSHTRASPFLASSCRHSHSTGCRGRGCYKASTFCLPKGPCAPDFPTMQERLREEEAAQAAGGGGKAGGAAEGGEELDALDAFMAGVVEAQVRAKQQQDY